MEWQLPRIEAVFLPTVSSEGGVDYLNTNLPQYLQMSRCESVSRARLGQGGRHYCLSGALKALYVTVESGKASAPIRRMKTYSVI